MWVHGGHRGREGEAPGQTGLRPPGPFLKGGGELGLRGGRRSVLYADRQQVLLEVARSLTQSGHTIFFPTPRPLVCLNYK